MLRMRVSTAISVPLLRKARHPVAPKNYSSNMYLGEIFRMRLVSDETKWLDRWVFPHPARGIEVALAPRKKPDGEVGLLVAMGGLEPPTPGL